MCRATDETLIIESFCFPLFMNSTLKRVLSSTSVIKQRTIEKQSVHSDVRRDEKIMKMKFQNSKQKIKRRYTNLTEMSSIVHIIDDKEFDCDVDLARKAFVDANGDAIDSNKNGNGKTLSNGTSSSDEENASTCSSTKDDDDGDDIIRLKTR